MTLEEYIPLATKFYETYLISFNDVTIALMNSLKLSVWMLIWPCRIILFSIHNYLTGRAYTYSLDDLCDLFIALSIFVWSYSFIVWSNFVPDVTP